MVCPNKKNLILKQKPTMEVISLETSTIHALIVMNPNFIYAMKTKDNIR